VLLGLFSTDARSQEIVPGRGRFQIDFDYASFYGDSAQVYFELYYGIHENMVSYRRLAGGLSGTVDFHWTIRKDSARIAGKEWTVPHTVNDTAELQRGQTLVGLQSVGLPPGEYTMTLVAVDNVLPGRRDSIFVPVKITGYDTLHESISDIELCTSVKSSDDRKSLFYKNTLDVIPNPGKLYGTGLPILYYYAEAYNLDTRAGQTFVIVRSAVIDATGKEVVSHERNKPRMHHSSVEIGTLNLSAVHGGSYLFQLTLLDTMRNILTASSKKFFIYKLGAERDTTVRYAGSDYTVSEFGVMNGDDCDNAFRQAGYLASQAEREQYERLGDVAAKRKFLYEFWKRRDTKPESPVNEFKDAYQKRIEEANTQYAWGMREGWKTDRGRIYLVYGVPDEIERFPSQSGSNPYEIWHYNSLQGGVIFVFVDRRGMGDYALVHSTHRDELHDDNWFQHYATQGQ
jgi:GWxTD domain-containing protein